MTDATTVYRVPDASARVLHLRDNCPFFDKTRREPVAEPVSVHPPGTRQWCSGCADPSTRADQGITDPRFDRDTPTTGDPA